MKELVGHLLANNMQEILQSSFMNCHVKGLHSIMLLQAPGKTIRLFVTTVNHELYLNYGEDARSLAFHPHQQNLTLHCIKGSFTNIVKERYIPEVQVNEYIFSPENIEHEKHTYHRWLYTSNIEKPGNMGFVPDGAEYLRTVSDHRYVEGQSVHMKAKDIHTVYCPAGSVNAWLVYEGIPDETYENIAFSNTDLSKATADGLYGKPTMMQIIALLKLANLV